MCDGEIFLNFIKCIYCRNRDVKKNINFIIIDIRIFDNDIKEEKDDNIFNEKFPGFLPKSIRITFDQLKSKDFPKNILNGYKEEKDKYHFIIITSCTKNYLEYENKFYKFTTKRKSIKGVYFKRIKELDAEKYIKLLWIIKIKKNIN